MRWWASTGAAWRASSDLCALRDPDSIIRPEAVAAVRAARGADKQVALLSNELDLFYGAPFRDRLSVLRDFHVIIDATYTKFLKPDPRAYALVLDALRLPPSDCIFVDDQERNVCGARAAGMITVLFDVQESQVVLR